MSGRMLALGRAMLLPSSFMRGASIRPTPKKTACTGIENYLSK
jgi:hypothetical protein